MKKFILYVFLVLIGGTLGFVLAKFSFGKMEYYILSSNYKSDFGEIKKGTKLKLTLSLKVCKLKSQAWVL